MSSPTVANLGSSTAVIPGGVVAVTVTGAEVGASVEPTVLKQ